MPMGGIELLVILAILLLFFGAKRVPKLARSLGTGARELKKAASEDADENSETKKEATSEDAEGGKRGAVSGKSDEGKTKAAVSEASTSERDGDGARAEREPRDD